MHSLLPLLAAAVASLLPQLLAQQRRAAGQWLVQETTPLRTAVAGRCGAAECKEGRRVLSGALHALDVNQGLICAMASLTAAGAVLTLLLLLLLSRLAALRRGAE